MRTSEIITRQIKDASEIVEIIGQYVTLKQAGRDFRGLCPFHKEKTPSFHVRPSEQYFKCFGCGAGGDVFKFIQLYHAMSFAEARELLAQRARIPLKADAGGASSSSRRSEILQLNRWAADLFRTALIGSSGTAAREYLKSRGIRDEMSETFQLGFAPDSYDFIITKARAAGFGATLLRDAGLVRERSSGGHYDVFRHRVMFPIIDPGGQVLGFGGRTLGDDQAKYINSPETSVFSKSRCLYGLHRARAGFKERQRAILVEGYTDVIMAHQLGFSETVAALGTAMTDQHADLLLRYVPLAVLVFDPDAPGQKAAERGLDIAIRSNLDVAMVRMPEGLDPCDFLVKNGAEPFEQLLKSAPSALEFKWSHILREHGEGSSSSAKIQAVQDFVSFVAAAVVHGRVDAIHRGLLVNQLATLLTVERTEIARILADAESGYHNKAQKSANVQQQDSKAPEKADPVQALALEVLTVLLCEPGLFSLIAEAFRPELLVDERLRHIAEVASDLYAQVGEFAVGELLEKFEQPEDTARILDLVERGRRAGELAARLEYALGRLASLQTAQQSDLAERTWLQTSEPSSDGTSDRDLALTEVHARTRHYAGRSNFAGIRKLS